MFGADRDLVSHFPEPAYDTLQWRHLYIAVHCYSLLLARRRYEPDGHPDLAEAFLNQLTTYSQ